MLSRIDLTSDEIKAVEFFRGRYQWANQLAYEYEDRIEHADGGAALFLCDYDARLLARCIREEFPSVSDSFRSKLEHFASAVFSYLGV